MKFAELFFSYHKITSLEYIPWVLNKRMWFLLLLDQGFCICSIGQACGSTYPDISLYCFFSHCHIRKKSRIIIYNLIYNTIKKNKTFRNKLNWGGEKGLRGGGAGKPQCSSRGRPGFRGTLWVASRVPSALSTSNS